MEDNKKMIESLLENVVDYGKTTLELTKLKALDKTSDVVSSFAPFVVVLILTTSFFLFLNLGLAFWLGEILGKPFYGFFIIAAFYAIMGIFMHFFMQKWIKKVFRNFFIKQLFK
jgi:hypothetical protein